jgi:hypothetical protein
VLANKDGSSAPGRITRDLEALLLTPSADPDAKRLLDQAKSILAGLQKGSLDRQLFTANGKLASKHVDKGTEYYEAGYREQQIQSL